MTPLRCVIGVLCVGVLPLMAACAVKQPAAGAESLKSALPPATIIPADWRAGGGVAGDVATEWVQTFGDPRLEALIA
jgi:hypothetical protein